MKEKKVTLKKWFNEVQIPLERRAKTAVLEINGQIVWVEGLGISNTVRPVENCNRLIIEREDTNGEPNACGH